MPILSKHNRDWRLLLNLISIMTDRLELIQVECYAGYKAEESPRTFKHQGHRYDIVEIIDRWYEGRAVPGTTGIMPDFIFAIAGRMAVKRSLRM